MPRELDLWPFDLKINGFPGLTVDHVCVKFGDPSCIGFWDIMCKNHTKAQTNQQTYRHINAAIIHIALHTRVPSARVTSLVTSYKCRKQNSFQESSAPVGNIQRTKKDIIKVYSPRVYPNVLSCFLEACQTWQIRNSDLRQNVHRPHTVTAAPPAAAACHRRHHHHHHHHHQAITRWQTGPVTTHQSIQVQHVTT